MLSTNVCTLGSAVHECCWIKCVCVSASVCLSTDRTISIYVTVCLILQNKTGLERGLVKNSTKPCKSKMDKSNVEFLQKINEKHD